MSTGVVTVAWPMPEVRMVAASCQVPFRGICTSRAVRCSYINHALGLDRSAARRNSPVWWLPPKLPPVVMARGGNETDEFVRQHDLMTTALRSRTPVVEVIPAERHHFDLPYDLGATGTELGDAVLAQMGLTGFDETCC